MRDRGLALRSRLEAERPKHASILTGLVLFLWFSYGLLRALHLVHAAAWRVPPPPLRSLPRAVGFVVAAPIVLLVATGAAGWARAHAVDPLGLFATLAIGIGFGAIWVWVSMSLPSQEVPWTAFLPGAILLGLGLEALHLFTTYFLEEKLASASDLYGVLGPATTSLFYLFLVGRGVVWAAELNAVVWEVRWRRS